MICDWDVKKRGVIPLAGRMEWAEIHPSIYYDTSVFCLRMSKYLMRLKLVERKIKKENHKAVRIVLPEQNYKSNNVNVEERVVNKYLRVQQYFESSRCVCSYFARAKNIHKLMFKDRIYIEWWCYLVVFLVRHI